MTRERVLTDDELRRVWLACGKIGPSAGAMVRALILTMQRRNEVAHMPRAELTETQWQIAASRTKNGFAMDVHRTAAFNAVLDSLPSSARTCSKAVTMASRCDSTIWKKASTPPPAKASRRGLCMTCAAPARPRCKS